VSKMDFDYWEEWQRNFYEVGVGQGIIVHASRANVINDLFKVYFYKEHYSGRISLDPSNDPAFANEPWIFSQRNKYDPNILYCNLSTVKQIMDHCTRLVRMRGFW